MTISSPAAVDSRDIDLVVSDIDGTLVTPDKTLTHAAAAAARRLAGAGLAFTLISSRPPRGMAALVRALDIRLCFAAFNGGSLVAPDGRLIESLRLAPEVARQMLGLLEARGVDAWVYANDGWWLRDPGGANVERERRTIGFDPTVVDSFDDVVGCVDKIVGVSGDHALLARVEIQAQRLIGDGATIHRSQPYYLDVTNPQANKGRGLCELCRHIGVDLSRTAVIGDMSNDVAMFARAGFSIAMGQAPEDVKMRAGAVTLSNDQEGFANAVDRLILPHATRAEL